MAFAAQPVDANGVPISAGYVPNTVFNAIQASTRVKTDTLSNTYTAPVFEQRGIEDVRSGLVYSATTGKLATATNGNLIMGASLFNPVASGKTILVLSARVMQSSAASTNQINFTTTDPAFATALTPVNQSAGGVASVLTTSITCAANNATASVAVTGTQFDTAMITTNTDMYEFVPPGLCFLLPSGVANGIAIFTTVVTAGQFWAVVYRYVEY